MTFNSPPDKTLRNIPHLLICAADTCYQSSWSPTIVNNKTFQKVKERSATRLERWKLTNIIYLSTTFLKACFCVRKMISGVVICAVSRGSHVDLMKVRSSVVPGGSKVIKLRVEILINVIYWSIWSESKHGTECQPIISLINQSGSNQKEEIENDLIPKDNTNTPTPIHTTVITATHFLFTLHLSVCIEVIPVLQETLRYNNCSKIILHTVPPVH